MKKKYILFIMIGILLLAAVSHFYAGTTITINGRQVSGIGGYIAAYLAMIVLAATLVLVVPSVFILAVVLSIIFVIFMILFSPLMPFASLLVPGIIFAAIVSFVYRLGKKKKS